MNGETWIAVATQLLGTGGLIFYMIRRMNNRADLDHDLLIRHDERLSKTMRDVNVAHQKIRKLEDDNCSD